MARLEFIATKIDQSIDRLSLLQSITSEGFGSAGGRAEFDFRSKRSQRRGAFKNVGAYTLDSNCAITASLNDAFSTGTSAAEVCWGEIE